MTEEYLSEIVNEARDDFHIPPYSSDERLVHFALEGEHDLLALVPNIDYDNDLKFKMLLKNYIFYANYGKVDEFFPNFNAKIIEWQFDNLGGATNEDSNS